MRAILIVGTIWLAACAAKVPPPAEPTYETSSTEEPAAAAPAEPASSDIGWSEWGNCEACDYDCGEWTLDQDEYSDCMSECGC
jgi:hypothetical protein